MPTSVRLVVQDPLERQLQKKLGGRSAPGTFFLYVFFPAMMVIGIGAGVFVGIEWGWDYTVVTALACFFAPLVLHALGEEIRLARNSRATHLPCPCCHSIVVPGQDPVPFMRYSYWSGRWTCSKCGTYAWRSKDETPTRWEINLRGGAWLRALHPSQEDEYIARAGRPSL